MSNSMRSTGAETCVKKPSDESLASELQTELHEVGSQAEQLLLLHTSISSAASAQPEDPADCKAWWSFSSLGHFVPDASGSVGNPKRARDPVHKGRLVKSWSDQFAEEKLYWLSVCADSQSSGSWQSCPRSCLLLKHLRSTG